MLKKLFFLFSFIVFYSNCSYSQGWTTLTSPDTNAILNSVYFIDSITGYAVGENSTSVVFFQTTNGGSTWTETLPISTTPGPNSILNSVYFIDSGTGYAVGGGGLLLKTTDGGATWANLLNFSDTDNYYLYLYSVYFTDSVTGFAVGHNMLLGNAVVLKTTNGGSNWTSQSVGGITGYLNSVYFTDSMTGYAVGYNDNGIIQKTINGSATWTNPIGQISIPDSSILSLNSVYFTDSDTGYAVGVVDDSLAGLIVNTTNGGISWTALNVGSQGLNSVYFTNSTTGYAVGGYSDNGGIILKTINGGSTWTEQTSGTTQGLNSVYFTDSITGYAVGWNGVILKTTTGGENANILNNTKTVNKNLKLYPNPNKGEFTVEFSNPEYEEIQIGITDLTGKNLFETTCTQELFNYNKPSLLPGVYMIVVKGDNLCQVIKMIVN